jgi:SAM-dependent methyltransferase
VITIGSHAVSRCASCGLGFLDSHVPEPGEEAAYDEEFYTSHKKVKVPAEGIRECLPKVRFVRKYRTAGRLLDVGCGLGYFLAAAAWEGFTVCGMEASGWATEYIRKEFGFPVWPADLEALPSGGDPIDVCTMWQVIEHVPDPLALLRKMRDLLKVGGVLIMETRNHRGFDAKMLKERWGGWSLPYHLWHFDPVSFRLLSEKAGFRVLRLKVHKSDYVKKALRKIPVLGLLRNPVAGLFAGSNITIVAERAK